jgi:micrococcal nuclease
LTFYAGGNINSTFRNRYSFKGNPRIALLPRQELSMPDQPKYSISAGKAFLLCVVVAIVTYYATVNAYRFQPKPAVSSLTGTQAQPPASQEILSSPSVEASPSPETPDYYTVARVIDPTILKLTDGTTVSLVGVASPIDELGESVQREALAFTKGLVEGKKVRLEYEAEYEKDSDGNTFAYVYLEDGTSLNAEILKKGYGSAATSYSFHLSRDFNRYEHDAQKRSLGLWNVPTDSASEDSTYVTDESASTSSSVQPVTVTTVPTPLPTLAPSRTHAPPLAESYSNSPSQQEPSVPYYVPPRPTYQPPVAENGSYYGEISEKTGRPKTVHVDGYTRRDGTYVRGYYRSTPRRH